MSPALVVSVKFNPDSRVRQSRTNGRPGGAPPQQRAPGRVLQDERGPKTPNLMASHEVFRCARCGNRLGLDIGLEEAWLREFVHGLGLPGVDVTIERVRRCGIAAPHVRFAYPADHAHRHLRHVLEIIDRCAAPEAARERARAAFRRIAEAAARNVPLMALLFVPLVLGMSHVYEWARPEVVAGDAHLRRISQVYLAPRWLGIPVIYFAIAVAFLFVLVVFI